MILVIASTSVRPERADEAAGLLAAAAATLRTEQGCLDYRFLRDTEDPSRFSSIEQWESRANHAAHTVAPHVQVLLAALADMVTAAPVITLHEVSAGAGYES